MRLGLKVTRTLGAAFLLVTCLILLTAPGTRAQVQLIVDVSDTTGDPGELNSAVTVYYQGIFDTVVAFELWLQLSRPEIMRFQTELDTVVDTSYWECLDWNGPVCEDSIAAHKDTVYNIIHYDTVEVYVGSLDTVGTLMAGFEMVRTMSFSDTIGTDIKVTAIADQHSVSGSHPGIPPQAGVLFRLLADVMDIPDTMLDRSVDIFIPPFLDNFNFSRTDGTSVGIITQEVVDSNFYTCEAWVPPEDTACLYWEKVNKSQCWPDCDSIGVEIDTVGILDTTAVWLDDGSLTVNQPAPWTCGHLDGDPEGDVDIGDMQMLIDHLFINMDPIVPPEAGNVDCTTEVPIILDVGDMQAMIDHLFIGMEPLRCQL